MEGWKDRKKGWMDACMHESNCLCCFVQGSCESLAVTCANQKLTTSAGLSRVNSCQLILVAELSSCRSYERHRRPRFCDCGLRTRLSNDDFFYDLLLKICLWTYVHHEHYAPEGSHDSSRAAASFLPVLPVLFVVSSFGSWRRGGHWCTSSTARVWSRPSR